MIVVECMHRQGDFSLDAKLNVPETGITAIFGPSGSGKSTLLDCIAGLHRPQSASIVVGGHVWQDSAKSTFLPTHRRAIGYVFQNARLFPHLTAQQNILFPLRRRGLPVDAAQWTRLVDILSIGNIMSKLPRQLSGGEAQRVAVARALIAQPDLLLMDEPLSGLDEAKKRDVLPFLEAIHRETRTPIVYVSHDDREIARLADNVVTIAAGRTGPLQSVFDFFRTGRKSRLSVLEVVVDDIDVAYGLATGKFDGGAIRLAADHIALGQTYRLQIDARDVSIVKIQPQESSILNVIATSVASLGDAVDAPHQVDVGLRAGSWDIVARISKKSLDALQLRLGDRVYAQVKSAALVR